MTTYGRQVLSGTGRPVMVIAGDGRDIHWKVGGITLDWGLFAAVGVDTTLSDETVVPNGQKYARYGQVLCRVKKTEIQTVTVAAATGARAAARRCASAAR